MLQGGQLRSRNRRPLYRSDACGTNLPWCRILHAPAMKVASRALMSAWLSAKPEALLDISIVAPSSSAVVRLRHPCLRYALAASEDTQSPPARCGSADTIPALQDHVPEQCGQACLPGHKDVGTRPASLRHL